MELNRRVMVVDDEEQQLRQLCGILLRLKKKGPTLRGRDSCGWDDLDIVCHLSGEAAVEEVARSRANDPFSVIFLDLNMPDGKGGAWAASEIRRLDPQVNIVIVTGALEVNPASIAQAAAPPDKLLYLQKPYHPYEIVHFASALCAKWRLETMLRADQRRLETLVARRAEQLAQANKQLREDISRRKEVERALKESEERYAVAARGANDGLWDWDLLKNRIFVSQREHWHEPLKESRDRLASWSPCNPTSAAATSAVSYYFGRTLQRALDIPVGIIVQAYAGTPIEGWMPKEIQADDPRMNAAIEDMKKRVN